MEKVMDWADNDVWVPQSINKNQIGGAMNQNMLFIHLKVRFEV